MALRSAHLSGLPIALPRGPFKPEVAQIGTPYTRKPVRLEETRLKVNGFELASVVCGRGSLTIMPTRPKSPTADEQATLPSSRKDRGALPLSRGRDSRRERKVEEVREPRMSAEFDDLLRHWIIPTLARQFLASRDR